MSKVLPVCCFCGGFQRPRCWWCSWVTQHLLLSCSLINSLSWQWCWGKQSHPSHITVVVFTFQSPQFPPGFYHTLAATRRMGKWGSTTTCEEVEEARGARGLCQWKLFMMLWLHRPSPTHLFTATSHTLLSDVSFHDSVASLSLCLLVT